MEPRPVDSARSGPLAGRDHATYHGIPPVKPAPFEMPHIPLYFWVGGIAAGSWLAATSESWAGDDDRAVVRAGRYLTLGSVMGGTLLLILDLGRPDRFLNMLRVFRHRSAMSLGSWALASFGALAGLAALLQAAEDGLLGEQPLLVRLSGGPVGRSAQLAGLPAALFVGSYTGVLLSSTATPTWARRAGTLSPLFTASAVANGLAAVDLALELGGGTAPRTGIRLSRSQALALAAEAAFEAVSTRAEHALPSSEDEPAANRVLRGIALAGMFAPLAVHAWKGWRPGSAADGGWRSAVFRAVGRLGPNGRRSRSRSPLRIAAAGLALAGGLALRWLTVRQGEHSVETPGDTWVLARREGSDDRQT